MSTIINDKPCLSKAHCENLANNKDGTSMQFALIYIYIFLTMENSGFKFKNYYFSEQLNLFILDKTF